MTLKRQVETQMLKSLINDASQTDSASVKLQASTDPVSAREFVKVLVIGSPKAVTKIIHTLYRLGFAEVTEWSQPVPTTNANEVMNVLRRCVFLS